MKISLIKGQLAKLITLGVFKVKGEFLKLLPDIKHLLHHYQGTYSGISENSIQLERAPKS